MSGRARSGRPDDKSQDDGASAIRPGGKVDPDALRELPPDPDLVSDAADDDAPRRVCFRLTRDLQKRLDKYLTDRIGFMSRTQLQRLIDEEQVTVNGRVPKASTTLRLGDHVEVLVPPPPPKEIQGEDIPLDVLYEDGEIIVINKSPDIIVHPARSNLSGTMVNALAWHFAKRSNTGGALSSVGSEFARPGVVHRLDRDTSGVIVFAKTDFAHWRLARQFEKRTVDKRYVAIVHGVVEPVADVIEAPIGPHPSREKGYREKYVVRHDELGKPSVTIYRVIESFDGFSTLEIELKTGRTHQIRVHMSHRGYPLVGDDMYGGKWLLPEDVGVDESSLPPVAARRREREQCIMGRQALHAAMLSFRHPSTEAPMRFVAPFPLDMANLVRILRRNRPGAGLTNVQGALIDLRTLAPDE